MTKSTLGRGLSSLIPAKHITSEKVQASAIDTQEKIVNVDIDSIQPNPQQPRGHIDREALEDLINSIKQHGIIQPLVVLKTANGYQLIAGERRLRAAKIIGKKKVPAVIRQVSDQEKLELALVENVQRQDLNPLEKAYGYQRLIDEFNLTQEEVAKKIGQSRAAVANSLRLLTLSPEIQKALAQGKISEGHAKVLLGVHSAKERQRLFKEILKNNLSVRITETQARRIKGGRRKQRFTKQDPNLTAQEDLLQSTLGTKVSIVKKGESGVVNIHFYSAEELQAIIKKITG